MYKHRGGFPEGQSPIVLDTQPTTTAITIITSWRDHSSALVPGRAVHVATNWPIHGVAVTTDATAVLAVAYDRQPLGYGKQRNGYSN